MEESKIQITDRKQEPKYGEPGSIMRDSKGKLYKVHEDGSWRRYKGGPSDPTHGRKN
jgi:hypothetical protein